MKKFIKAFAVLFAITMLFSCANESTVSETLTDVLNSTSADVDLGGASYDEDAIINTKKKISNADFGGRTLTVNASGVILDNVRNVNIVASDKIGDGDLEIKNSNTNSVTILGGGKNSIHFSNSIVVSLDVAKTSVRIVLEGSSTIEAVKVTAKGTTFKSDGESIISNFSVEAGVDTVNISGGSIKNITLKTDGTTTAPSITVKGKVKIDVVASVNIVTNEKSSAKIVVSAEAKADGFEAPAGADVTDSEDIDEDEDTEDDDTETTDENLDTDKPFEDGEVSDNPKITEAFNLLFDGDYDAAIAKFREAYNEKQNDETKLYYALAEIATISTDESVADLLKNNFGFKNYPSKLNTLFSDEWFEATPDIGYRSVYKAEPANVPENGSYYGIYVRGDGIPSSNYMGIYTSSYMENDDGDIISAWNYYFDDFTPSATGKYFVNGNYFSQALRDNENIQGSLFTVNYLDRKPYIQRNSTVLPFKVPEWLKETDTYKDTLFNSIETASTNSLAFFASLVDCNPNGFNEAIDKANNIFGQKYNNAKNLIASLSQNSIEVPEKVIERLNLSSILGEDENIYIGKAEANVLVAAIDIIRATLKYISSYDLSLDSSKVKPVFDYCSYDFGEFFDDIVRLLFKEAFKSSTLTVRNQNTMNESKSMFKEAFEMALASYNFIVKNSTYPQAVKDIIEENCHVWFEGVESLVNALNNNGVFYIPSSWQPASWPVSSDNALFGIDMGKLFTSGFSDVVKHSSNGGVLFYAVMDSRGRDYLSTEYFDLANYNNSLWELADSLSKSNSIYQGGTLVYTLVFDLNKIYALLPGLESVFSDLATEDNFFLDIGRTVIIPTPNND